MLLRKLLKTKRNQFLVKLNRNQIKSREDFQSLVFALKLASFPCQNKKPKETKGGIDQWKRQQKLEISFPPIYELAMLSMPKRVAVGAPTT